MRVIHYAGIERPILTVFGETPRPGFLFSPQVDGMTPFQPDWPSIFMGAHLQAMAPGLTLHSLRHTFATWRLMMGDPLLTVKGLMGHSALATLTKYSHIQPDPMQDLLGLLP